MAVIPGVHAVPLTAACAQVSSASGANVTTGSGMPPGLCAHQARQVAYSPFGAAGWDARAVTYGSPSAVPAQYCRGSTWISAVGIAAHHDARVFHGPAVYQASALAFVATNTTRRPDGSIRRPVGWILPDAS